MQFDQRLFGVESGRIQTAEPNKANEPKEKAQPALPNIFREHTPIDELTVDGRTVLVKREDLYAAYPAPPLAKLRGVCLVLEKLQAKGVKVVGCWDTRISELGRGVAVCAPYFGMQAIVSYPKLKDDDTLPRAMEFSKRVGAEVLPVPAGRIPISFAAARKVVEARGGYMLPFGLQCEESVESIRREAATVPVDFTQDATLVLSVGSGVTTSGIALGLRGRPRQIIALSAGRSPESIQSFMNKFHVDQSRIKVVPALENYSIERHDHGAPFPIHPNYDAKAWLYMKSLLPTIDGPVLFWNIGAVGKMEAD